jgi:4-hydroxyproline epimerase
MPSIKRRIQIIDSHTAGEPTRVIIEGGPELGDGPLSHRLERFRQNHDGIRSAVVNEPRGSDVMVGALLVPPVDPTAAVGIIFFNNVGYLGMCGHGTLGVAATLAHLGRISPGTHRFETPVGDVRVTLDDANHATIENVPSFRAGKGVPVAVPGLRAYRGDVAWGGNWFYLVEDHGEELTLANVDRLTDVTWRIRQALNASGITGSDGHEIDHIELFGPAMAPGAHSRNFVLCPGKAYDRSPCGTGTSAKVACLAADGKLGPGEVWRQESIIGSLFEASYRLDAGTVRPTIRGSAFVNAEATLILDPADPFAMGIRS